MQDDIGAARFFRERRVVERIDFGDLGPRRRTLPGARPHLADDGPAGGAERFRRRIAQPAGRPENKNA